MRARIRGADDGSMSVEVADGSGLPVLSVGSLVTRPVGAEQLAAALRGGSGVEQGLLEVVWSPMTLGDREVEHRRVVSWDELTDTDTDGGARWWCGSAGLPVGMW